MEKVRHLQKKIVLTFVCDIKQKAILSINCTLHKRKQQTASMHTRTKRKGLTLGVERCWSAASATSAAAACIAATHKLCTVYIHIHFLCAYHFSTPTYKANFRASAKVCFASMHRLCVHKKRTPMHISAQRCLLTDQPPPPQPYACAKGAIFHARQNASHMRTNPRTVAHLISSSPQRHHHQALNTYEFAAPLTQEMCA